VRGERRQSAVRSATYSPCRLCCLCQLLLLLLLLLFQVGACCTFLKFIAEHAEFESKHLCFTVYFKNSVSLVKIKLNDQGTVNAKNIFNTITEVSNSKFAYWC
jgi:cell division protein YceG involved in septum cleavage